MEPSTALKLVENSLRDFIEHTLVKRLGDNWIENCGVTNDRIQKWIEKKATDTKKMELSGIVESRLLYYSDFYDLKPILKKYWAVDFSPAFGDFKKMDVFLDILGTFRNGNAHGREFLPHQTNLVLGIVGEIRTMIIRYRSMMETSEDMYPRIESIRDSLGNTMTFGNPIVSTKQILKIGDTIDFTITATDPLGEEIEFALYIPSRNHLPEYGKSNQFSVTIDERSTGKTVAICFHIRSMRTFHSRGEFDDFVEFHYEILPIYR
jgi:hypothetical protein